jgi:Bifunctional DNA primase/polymerase, N-terminal
MNAHVPPLPNSDEEAGSPHAIRPGTTKLEHALELAREGFSVFPLLPNSKRPAIQAWQFAATTDETRIREWLSANPDYNIAVVTGARHGGLIVLDEDPRNGGSDTMRALIAIEDFPSTRGAYTAGGGVHYYYRANGDAERIRFGKNVLGPGVDIPRYVVAPGSTIDGREYRWVKPEADC